MRTNSCTRRFPSATSSGTKIRTLGYVIGVAPRKPRPGCDIATLRPDLSKEAFGWDPSTVSEWSGQRVDWKCGDGHVWKARVAERTRGNGCPFCAGNRAISGVNDLATLNPSVAREAVGWDPSTPLLQ